MSSAGTNPSGHKDTSNGNQPFPSVSEGFSMTQGEGHGAQEQDPDATSTLSPFRFSDELLEPFGQIADMNALDPRDPLLKDINSSARASSFDFSDGDTTNVLGDPSLQSELPTASSDETSADLLDLDFGMTPLDSLPERSCLTESGPPQRASPKPSLSKLATANSKDKLSQGAPSFDPRFFLRTSPPPSSQEEAQARPSQQLSGALDRRQSDVFYMSPPRLDTSGSLTEDFTYNKRSFSLPSCQCMQKVLVVYEEVETKTNSDKVGSTDYYLNFQKSVLGQCSRMLKCSSCGRTSGFVMLLITICERLMSSFRRILGHCSDTLRRYQEMQQGSQSPKAGRAKASGDVDDGDGGKQKVFVGGYGIESPQEQYCLVITVIELQLKDFRSLLLRLHDLTVRAGWEKHISMLHPIDDQMQDILTKLRGVRSDALGESSHATVSLFRRYSLE